MEIDSGVLPDDVFLRYFDLGSSPKHDEMNIHLLWLDPSAPKRKELIQYNAAQMSRCLGCHSTGPGSHALTLIQVTYGEHPRRRIVSIGPGEDGPRSYKISPPLETVYFPRPSPHGDKIACSVATSTGLFLQAGGTANFESSEPFEDKFLDPVMDVAIYDPKSGSATLLAGASDPNYNEESPVWSPDGKKIAFMRYRKGGKMDIYVVPYNDGKGGVAKPLAGASGNGWDNYFPEYSPDGRWIAFTRGDAGTGKFARDSSDIYLVPAQGGRPRRLEFNVDGVMDSWHSWSSDSRWLLYSTKRDGISTKAYVARIFEDGRAAAPFELAIGLESGQRVNMPSWIKKGEIDSIPIEQLDQLDDAEAPPLVPKP
jgi:hypothetical protein